MIRIIFFFFQAEDGIRDVAVTGVQTCALPILFGTESLRFEKWSIADAKPVEVRELVVRRDCMEQEFSPDGKYLACVDYNLGLNVIETQTGKRIFQKKEFATLNPLELLLWIVRTAGDDDASHENAFFSLQFSPDSRYLLAGRSNKFRFRIFIDSRAIGETRSEEHTSEL